METLVKFGPADHGQPITLQELDHGEFVNGYHYELIEGRLYVSPIAGFTQHWLKRWLIRKFDSYSESNLQIVNYVAFESRVFLPGEEDKTCPEPDFSLYRNVPLERPIDEIHWRDLRPFLVGEVLTGEEGADKDLVRNVRLFLRASFIKEYWVLDGREDIERPILRVYRRSGRRWKTLEVAFGETYTTKILPGFELLLNPRR